jgi:hypothetical protein
MGGVGKINKNPCEQIQTTKSNNPLVKNIKNIQAYYMQPSFAEHGKK